MPETAVNFTALLARAQGGDREALDQLTREYEPKLRLVARVLLGPALRPYLDSVDLVQSVYKSLLLGLHNRKFAFDTSENLLALALTLVRAQSGSAMAPLATPATPERRNWHVRRSGYCPHDFESAARRSRPGSPVQRSGHATLPRVKRCGKASFGIALARI